MADVCKGGICFDATTWGTGEFGPLDTDLNTHVRYCCYKNLSTEAHSDSKLSKAAITLNWGSLDYQLQDYFPNRTQNYIAYHFWCKVGAIASPGKLTQLLGFSSHGDSDAAPDGAVALRLSSAVDDTQYQWDTLAKKDGSWSVMINNNGANLDSGEDEYHLVTLLIDLASSPPEVKVLRDGVEYLPYTASADIVAASVISTPGLGGPDIDVKGDSQAVNVKLDSLFVYDGSTDGTVAKGTTYGVWAFVPEADEGAAGWTATGNEANCATHLWRAIDDLYDDADQANDYISADAEGGAAHDQLFDFTSRTTLSSGTVDGVGLVCISITASIPNNGLAKYGANTDVLTFQWVHYSTYSSTGFAWMQFAPGSVAWTRAVFNGSFFGVRATGSGTRKCYGLMAYIVGSGLSSPADAQACPAAGVRRIFITHN